jgi:hypothetical protein
MYMLWPHGRSEPHIPSRPQAYSLSTIVSEDMDKARQLVEMDGPLGDSGWSWFRNAVVPDGMFVRSAAHPHGSAPLAPSIIPRQLASIFPAVGNWATWSLHRSTGGEDSAQR